jgi:hypothetical protein
VLYFPSEFHVHSETTWQGCASFSAPVTLLSLFSLLKNFFSELFEFCFVSVGFSCVSINYNVFVKINRYAWRKRIYAKSNELFNQGP